MTQIPPRIANQSRTLLRLLAALRPHWHRDRDLPNRIRALLAGDPGLELVGEAGERAVVSEALHDDPSSGSLTITPTFTPSRALMMSRTRRAERSLSIGSRAA